MTAAASYTATFRAVNNRTVIWVNWDGTELDRATVTAEQTPEYTGVMPERAGDEQYAYVFSGWEPVQGPNDSDMIYKAVLKRRREATTSLGSTRTVMSCPPILLFTVSSPRLLKWLLRRP